MLRDLWRFHTAATEMLKHDRNKSKRSTTYCFTHLVRSVIEYTSLNALLITTITQASCRFPQRREQDAVITIFNATGSVQTSAVVRATFYDLLSRKWILSPHIYSACASDLT